MTTWRNKMALGLLSAVVLTSLAGCGGSTATKADGQKNSEGANGSAAAKPVKLRINWWGAQERHDATLKILELYTKNHPNVTFEPEYSGFDGYIDKLNTQAAAKNAPDIIQMDSSWLADWNARGQLADLGSVNVKDMDASLVESGKYKGKQTAIPLGKNAWGLIYDKGALEKLGFKLPGDGITWDAYYKLAREIKAKLDKDHYVMSDSTSNRELYDSYQLSKGKGDPVTLDGKFNYDRDTWLEWVKNYSELRKEGIVPPPDVAVGDKELDPKLDLMVNGKIIFRAAHAAQASSWDSLKPGGIGVYPAPKDKQNGSWLKATFFFGVSQDSKNKEEATKFVDWFINDPEAMAISGTTRGVPPSNKIIADMQSKFKPGDKLTVEMIEKIAPGAQRFNPGAKGWNNFYSKDYKAITEAVMFGKMTPEQAYDELKKKASEYEK
ncbi:ABC transporter substrate-binding protein [Paenibacillus piri]|uniref:Extracellular solute-binding protein n=1 Tax=Paenibacillus piri TaxID=2547395 RepID=A0A4R5KZ03_9BACL|nr:extracellular solute-binding protein [Paenibacillus piri]TDG00466.1 extracellular solute-binding protein [Paenibacillus piri]